MRSANDLGLGNFGPSVAAAPRCNLHLGDKRPLGSLP